MDNYGQFWVIDEPKKNISKHFGGRKKNKIQHPPPQKKLEKKLRNIQRTFHTQKNGVKQLEPTPFPNIKKYWHAWGKTSKNMQIRCCRTASMRGTTLLYLFAAIHC